MCEIGINELKLNIYDIKLSQNTVINAFFYFIASHLYGLRPHHLSYNSPGIGNVGTINMVIANFLIRLHVHRLGSIRSRSISSPRHCVLPQETCKKLFFSIRNRRIINPKATNITLNSFR